MTVGELIRAAANGNRPAMTVVSQAVWEYLEMPGTLDEAEQVLSEKLSQAPVDTQED